MKHFKSLAIIGSSGMVGKDLMQYLKPYFQKTVGIDRKNYNQYKGKRFDVVLNANGNSNKVWAKDHVLEDFEASTVSVYKSLYDFSFKTYIYISSADVYPNHTSKKTTKESLAVRADQLSSYGLHKYLSEEILRNSKRNYIILRCPMILGTKLKKGPIYDILGSSRLFISPESAFQMIITKELAQIINMLLSNNIKCEVFNVGGNGAVRLREVTDYLKRSVKFPKESETHMYEMNVSKLHKIYKLKTSREYLQDFLKTL